MGHFLQQIAEVAAVFSTPPHQPLGTPHGHTPPHHLAGSATPIRPDSRASTIFSPAPPSSPAVFSIGKYQLLMLVHFEQRLIVT